MIYLTPAVALATNPQDINNAWIGYQSCITRDNVTADEEATGFPVTNVQTTSTAEKWKGTSTALQYIQVADGGSQDCDYFALAKHNFGSTGATLKLQNSADAVTWNDVTEDIIPATDYAIMFRFEADRANYWRLAITPGSAAPELAIFYLGELLVAQRRIYVGHTPLTLGRNQVVSTGLSDNGAFLGRIKRREFLSSAVELKNLTPGWYRTEFDPFAEASAERPFFWAWRPGTYPDEVGYAWVTGAIKPANSNPNGMMSVGFEMQGVR